MLADLRFALRQLARSPGFAAAAILTIALGIGSATSIFSVADAVLLRPLPYPNSNRLVMVWDQLRTLHVNELPLSGVTFDAYRSNHNIFESAAAFREQEHNLTGVGEVERVSTLATMPGLSGMLGARTAIGRDFTDQDYQPGHQDAAILSYELFSRHFGSDPHVLGKTIALDNQPYTVVGVFAPGFDFDSRDLWTPLPPVTDPRMWQFRMLAKLRPNVGVAAAQASVTAAAQHVEETVHPYRGPNGEDAGYHAKVISLHDQLLSNYRSGALILFGAVGLVLLIACVNVANLLLARAASREKETAIRRALGASRLRLIRQWLTESCLLALLGGSAGALASVWGVRTLALLYPYALPDSVKIGLNGRALLFAFVISVLVCVLSGIVPAISAARVSTTLRGPGLRSSTASALIVAEVALSLLLLVGAGLLLKSFARLQEVNPGFRADHLLTLQAPLAGPSFNATRRIQFYSELQQRLAAIPGVIATSSVSRLPVLDAGIEALGGNPFSIEGRPWNPSSATPQIMHDQVVGLDYFRTMQIPLLSGRDFGQVDAYAAAPVAIVNATLARGFFPNGDAIGHHILLGAPQPDSKWMTIVGVVGDVKTAALTEKAMPQVYRPYMQYPVNAMRVIVRTAGDPLQMTRTATGIVHMLNPEVPVYAVQTMDQRVEKSEGRTRFQTTLLAFFAAVALLLAAIGIYGVVAHSTVQRTKEIAIRMALGADAPRVLRHILRGGLRPVLLGIVAGVAAALMFSRVLGSVLFEVAPRDLTIFLAAPILLGAVAIAACLEPARRAIRIDPQAALRLE